MKKILISIIALFILTTSAEITNEPIHKAEASGYGYRQANYYSWGSCAFYAFNRRAQMGKPVSNMWGNARNWAYNARRQGYTISRKPRYGAVMVSTAGYYGHVSVVERVNKNGSYLVSEMNFPRLGVKTYRTLSKSQAKYYQFIY